MGYLLNLRKTIGTQPVVVAGVSVIILNDQQEVLLIQRTDNNLWGLPAGSIEINEAPEQAAIREVFEETGLTLEKEKLVLNQVFGGPDFFYTYPNGDQCSNIVASYMTQIFSGQLTTCTNETKNAKFFSWTELPQEIARHEKIMLDSFKDNNSSSLKSVRQRIPIKKVDNLAELTNWLQDKK